MTADIVDGAQRQQHRTGKHLPQFQADCIHHPMEDITAQARQTQVISTLEIRWLLVPPDARRWIRRQLAPWAVLQWLRTIFAAAHQMLPHHTPWALTRTALLMRLSRLAAMITTPTICTMEAIHTTAPGQDKKQSFETIQQEGTPKSSATTSTRNKVRAALPRISKQFSHFDFTIFEICGRFLDIGWICATLSPFAHGSRKPSLSILFSLHWIPNLDVKRSSSHSAEHARHFAHLL